MATADNQSKTVLITGARAPVALHLSRLFAASGHRVFLADCVLNPIAAVGITKSRYCRLPPFSTSTDSAAEALRGFIGSKSVDLVIPTCEEVLHLAAIWKRYEMGTHLFAPCFTRLEEVHSKYRFIRLCKKIGLNVPETHLLENASDLARYTDPTAWVFKPVWSRFGTKTVIRPNRRELRKVNPSIDVPWVAQEAISGEELCVYAVAQEGQITALSTYRSLVKSGPGAAICFEPVVSQKLRDFVASFVAGTQWTGQISFDFICKPDGEVLPIECNPRTTSGVHFFSPASKLPLVFFGYGREVQPDIHTPQGIRMALWLYGLPQIFGPARQNVLRAFRQVEDVLSCGDHPVRWSRQVKSVSEFAHIAIRERIGLQSASTWGIEWNGYRSIS